jgi:palmitoyl-protein thioesterase
MIRALIIFAAVASGQSTDLTGLRGVEGLLELVKMSEDAPEALAQLIGEIPELRAVVPTFSESAGEKAADAGSSDSEFPFVLAHGMGDSCFNPGMKSITNAVGKHAGSFLKPAYSTCIPTGDTQAKDTNNGFFLNMDKSVDVFAQKIMSDPKLAQGFYCIGFSQGNSLCRGYIQKYNNPPVKAHLSVHGTVAGVAGFPNCNPSKNRTLSSICDILASCLDLAYTQAIQNHLFQADYYRDPRKLDSSGYKKYSQIAAWNNEGDADRVNATFKTNFEKTTTYVMVKAMKDTMVYPNEAEHWGQFAPGGFETVLPMKETSYYQQDLFGLKTVDAAGGIFFETTPGNHLQFAEKDLFGWLDKYILKKSEDFTVVI